MTASERQERIVSEYAFIEDPRERFQVVVETTPREPFPEAARIDANLVPGCVSRVWIAVWRDPQGGVEVRVDSESPALRGIGTLFAQVYSGSTPEEIASTEPTFLDRLAIDRHLTPTRRRGLANLRRCLVEAACALDREVQK